MSCTPLSCLGNNATSRLLRRSRCSVNQQQYAGGGYPVYVGRHLMLSGQAHYIHNFPLQHMPCAVGLSSFQIRTLENTHYRLSSSLTGTFTTTTGSSSGHFSSASGIRRQSVLNWEVLFSTCAAFAVSAALVASFPSKNSRNAARLPSSNSNFSSGGGSDGGDYSFMSYAAAPSAQQETVPQSLFQREEIHEKEEDDDGENDNVDQVKHMSTSVASPDDPRKVYDISIRAIRGGRVTMEDEFFVADGGRFAAVFDGHGGGGVSSFLKHHLYNKLIESLTVLHLEERETSPNHQKHPSLACHVAALRDAFSYIENSVLENDDLHYQGSTAVAVMLHDSDTGHRTVLSANVGDSRAILSRRGHAIDLTRDHKPSEEREKARILAMGETIEWDRFSKVHRVRNLSLSRAIGDRYAKPVVSAEVEIKHFPVLDDGDEFILLASDGLWDAMSSQDVVTYVHNRFAKEITHNHAMDKEEKERYKLVLRKNMAKFVALEALRRGSGDNICVVMVWLDDLAKPSSLSSS